MRLSLKIKGIDAAVKAVKNLSKEAEQGIQDELNAFGFLVEGDAKAMAPADEGNLRNSITSEPGKLSVSIFARIDYAAYLEFGTRKFAAAYVNTLPPDWQTYAAEFRGGTGGSGDFFDVIMRWVRRKGIEPEAAYPIALSILRNGIRAHPFMFPAFQKNVPELEKNLKQLFR